MAEALKIAGRKDLIGTSSKSLISPIANEKTKNNKIEKGENDKWKGQKRKK